MKFNRIIGVLLKICGLFTLFLLILFLYHRMQLKKEVGLLVPLGQEVQVEDGKMSLYSEGAGDQTLVFLSGGGTSSPILDFKSLTSLLEDSYRVVVIEKFGYGFSQDTNRPRDIRTLVEDNRKALKEANIRGPLVLCPHSMSGLEALYWAKTYPEEVRAIVGLDMAIPPYYEKMKINRPLLYLSSLGVRLGVTRLIPGISESDAIKGGSLSPREKEVYQAVFYKRTLSGPMLGEMDRVQDNARFVEGLGLPSQPILAFLSQGIGGDLDRENWRKIPRDYFGPKKNILFIDLDCPHYLHDYEYERIGREMEAFLRELP